MERSFSTIHGKLRTTKLRQCIQQLCQRGESRPLLGRTEMVSLMKNGMKLNEASCAILPRFP